MDGRWIVGAEHGPRNVKYYYLSTEALGRQFVEKGFFIHVARILFNPQGVEMCRAGWNGRKYFKHASAAKIT